MDNRGRSMKLCLLAMTVFLSGGCYRALQEGAGDGVNAAVSAVVEAILVRLLSPVTPASE